MMNQKKMYDKETMMKNRSVEKKDRGLERKDSIKTTKTNRALDAIESLQQQTTY